MAKLKVVSEELTKSRETARKKMVTMMTTAMRVRN
jgi:hypothetical protein